ARCISRMSSRISPSMGVVQATASGFSSASTGGSRVGASGPQFPGVLDAIPAKAAKARTRASARRSESGPSGALVLEDEQLGGEAREPRLAAARETTAEIESQSGEPEGQGTPSK